MRSGKLWSCGYITISMGLDEQSVSGEGFLCHHLFLMVTCNNMKEELNTMSFELTV